MIVSKFRLTLVVAVMLLLSIFPLNGILELFRPFWLLLFIIYMQSTLPRQCSVLLILCLGLLLDVVRMGVLGQQTVALLFVAFVVSKRAQRFRLFSMPQQLFGIAVFSFLYQLILVLIEMLSAYPISPLGAMLPVLMSVLCWPWLQYLVDRIIFGSVSRAI